MRTICTCTGVFKNVVDPPTSHQRMDLVALIIPDRPNALYDMVVTKRRTVTGQQKSKQRRQSQTRAARTSFKKRRYADKGLPIKTNNKCMWR